MLQQSTASWLDCLLLLQKSDALGQDKITSYKFLAIFLIRLHITSKIKVLSHSFTILLVFICCIGGLKLLPENASSAPDKFKTSFLFLNCIKQERIILPILWHFGNLNFTYYGNLRQPEFVNFGCWSPQGGGCWSIKLCRSIKHFFVYSGTVLYSGGRQISKWSAGEKVWFYPPILRTSTRTSPVPVKTVSKH